MTSSKLKIIAIISMIFSHVSIVFSATDYSVTRLLFNMGVSWGIGSIFSFNYIGRIAFPIFAYLIAEGCRHTKDIKYFMLRLLMFGVISQMFYKFALHPDNIHDILSVFTRDLNIFFTLFLGVFAVYLYEKMRGKGEHIIACLCSLLACCIIAEVFQTDYSLWGVLLIFICYIIRARKLRLIALGVWIFLVYGVYSQWNGIDLSWVRYAQNGDIENILEVLVECMIPMFAVLFLALYNGERGMKLKYVFYAVYPVHLMILLIIKNFIY